MTRVITLSPKEQKTIIALFGAARRAFARQFDDPAEIACAAFVWASWHATAAYKFKTPIARCAVALGIDAEGAAERLSMYNKIVAREPGKVAAAKRDFIDIYRQTTGEDMSEFNL